ncbi:isoprenylcysteine alpha-carbonyl methylesterase ICME [Citrus sinensis]|uniref:Isoprenylcysteine alpha-carbonyl methylesterase ICME n=1 Tax=Citrus sinensis TaxID=2711 RepID=A0ACB8K3P1_CITSI|nr:isoprenylcysteine alpha-carbonyl methylesterase ICME [Citrus sinensis]
MVSFGPSSNYVGSNNQQRRRRPAGSKPEKPRRQNSFSRDIGHAAAETYLITRLTFTLLRYLGLGYRWISRLVALGCYAMLLLPGFLQVAYYYFFSSQVRRSVVYGDQPRNRLDLHFPTNNDGPKPVVVFVTGGAWIIGYKAWGSLLGRQLAERDIIVACLDYRNFPQGTISDMVKDVSQGISFVFNNIADYGGDPNRYNLLNLVDHCHNRGLYRSIFLSIMEGEESLPVFSPAVRIKDPSIRDASSLLPPIILFHGTSDYSIPSDASMAFADALQKVGAKPELVLYPGKSHTDLFLQDPLRGGKDDLFDHIIAAIHANDKEALAKDAMAPPRKRLVPEPLLRMARLISPF